VAERLCIPSRAQIGLVRCPKTPRRGFGPIRPVCCSTLLVAVQGGDSALPLRLPRLKSEVNFW
jgi:hypothetical protein